MLEHPVRSTEEELDPHRERVLRELPHLAHDSQSLSDSEPS